MRKLLFTLLIISNCWIVKGQAIYNFNISPTPNNSIIDINLFVDISTISEFISTEYSIDDNIISMNVCYWVTGQQVSGSYEHTFPVTVQLENDYTIIINLYRSLSDSVCDFTALTDSASLNFSTPLMETIFLSVDEYININNHIILFSNPIKTNLKYKTSSSIEIKSVEFYSILGEKLKTFSGEVSDINVSSFSNGLYFVIFNTNNGFEQKQIIINN